MAERAHTTPRNSPPITVITSRRIAVATALLALSGSAAAGEAKVLQSETPLGGRHPDAALIALCAEVAIHRDRVNQESTLDADECPDWAAYTRCADAISEAEPQTFAGLVAKAHAAKLEAEKPDGSFDPAGTMAERWAWDLVNDLIRLCGRV